MSHSQNGWPLIGSASSLYLRDWTIPARSGSFKLPLRVKHAGFVLVHFILWYAEEVETVAGAGDDFGWALRKISGSDEWSNHASGTAGDLNASKHPQGVDSFTIRMADRVHRRLESPNYSTVEGPAIKWGGDYRTTIDQMHFEINVSAKALNRAYDACLETPRGKRIQAAN